MNVNNARIQQSVITITNTSELATMIIKDIAGNDIANSINGNLLTTDALRSLVISRIALNISKLNDTKN